MARTKAFDQHKAQIQAMAVFWRKGYAATSIEDLTEALQLSRSSLYDTFGDKRTLFLTVLAQYSQQVTTRIRAVIDSGASPLEAVRLIFADLLASANTSRGEQGCFMVNSVAELVPFDPMVTKIAAEYSAVIQQMLTKRFREAAADGQMDLKASPEHLAAYVFNAIQGIRLLIKSGADRDQLQAIVDLTLKTLT